MAEMLSAERQEAISLLVTKRGAVRTIELAEEFGVTDETIRKDLVSLEALGSVIRVHGGAIRPERSLGDLPLTERQLVNRGEKAAIARQAATRIQPNETIFLDASSTSLTLASVLPEIPLTVLTNAHPVFGVLEGRKDLDLICTGGLYEPRSRSFVGLSAEASLRRYNVHRMFFSGNGVDLDRGISESNSRQAAFKERVINCSEDVVFLADHTKMGRKSAFFFAGIEDLTTLVTDIGTDEGIIETFRSQGVEVQVAAP